METLFNSKAPKKPTNLSLNSDLLEKSRKLNINLSATLEEALKQKIAENKTQKWAWKNKKAIKTYNDFVDAHGCFGDEFREF
jgi:antitoxin CcdA